jgi:hypothetical protein
MEKEEQIRGTLSQYKDFENSVIWYDLSNEVKTWLEDVRSRLESLDDFNEIRRYQGISEACRYFLQLPSSLISILEVRSNDSA